MTPAVEKWFSGLTGEQRKVAAALRDIVLSQDAGLGEELKWGQPCFLGKSMVCYLQTAKRHVSLGFSKGARLTDPDRILEGRGVQMRHVKVLLGTEPDRQRLAQLVSEAIALDAAG